MRRDGADLLSTQDSVGREGGRVSETRPGNETRRDETGEEKEQGLGDVLGEVDVDCSQSNDRNESQSQLWVSSTNA